MKLIARTPNRIDLSGGTLDIYPLYVFMNGGMTLNAAIDMYSEVTLETQSDDGFVFYSQDLDLTKNVSRQSLLEDDFEGDFFQLLIETVKFYLPHTGLKVTTYNQAPKGSGLGASSALLIALSGALNHLNSDYLAGEKLIEYGANLEALSLGIPTGKQDYFPAVYGGVNALHFSARGIRREPLRISADFLAELNASLIISFSGQSHFSGTNNWSMMKRYIDNEGETRAYLKRIKATSTEMRESLIQADLPQICRLIATEWENRKALAEGVTTPEIESMMAAAQAEGAKASKICGAGGGGCMITLCSPSDKDSVKAALSHAGASILEHQITLQGLGFSQ